MTAGCGVGQEHRDLGALDAPQRCRCTGGPHPDRLGALRRRHRSRRRGAPPAGRRTRRTRSRAGPRAPRRRPRTPGPAGAQPVGGELAAMLGDRRAVLAIRPESRSTINPAARRSGSRRAKRHSNAVEDRAERLAPPGQDLCCKPRRPRRLRCSTQTPDDRPVAAPHPADTPPHSPSTTQITTYGCSQLDDRVRNSGLSQPAGARARHRERALGSSDLTDLRPRTRHCGVPH